MTSTVPVAIGVEKPAFPPIRGAGFWYIQVSDLSAADVSGARGCCRGVGLVPWAVAGCMLGCGFRILRRLVMIAISGAEVQFPRGKLHFCARNRGHERAVPSGGRSISTSGPLGAVILSVRLSSAVAAPTPKLLVL